MTARIGGVAVPIMPSAGRSMTVLSPRESIAPMRGFFNAEIGEEIMARPQKFEDLNSYEQRDHTFLEVQREYLTEDITVGAAVLNLIEACRKSQIFDVSEDGEFKVTLPKTQEERDRAVRSAQQSWDWKQEEYQSLGSREHQVEDWRRHSIDAWAKGEGLPAPDWEAHDARFEVAA